jgi:hypothetical protein
MSDRRCASWHLYSSCHVLHNSHMTVNTKRALGAPDHQHWVSLTWSLMTVRMVRAREAEVSMVEGAGEPRTEGGSRLNTMPCNKQDTQAEHDSAIAMRPRVSQSVSQSTPVQLG